MASDPLKENAKSPAYPSSANAEFVEESSIGLTSPAYTNSAGGADANNEIATDVEGTSEFNDEGKARSDFNKLKNGGASSATNSNVGIYIKSHPSLIHHGAGDYRYYVDKGTKEPMLVGAANDNRLYAFDDSFALKINNFCYEKDRKNKENSEKYIIFKDVEITGAVKFVKDKFLWFDGTEEMELEAFNMKKNLSSGEIEITPPGASLGTFSLDLSKPYFGAKANLKPSFNAGIFGFEFDVEKKEMGLSLGLEQNGIGLEVKVIFLVNTDKTSEDATQFICYDLLPWVGELNDALGG